MEATIDREKGYTVADIKVKGKIWSDTPYVDITLVPRDGSPQFTFSIALNDWVRLSAAVTQQLADHI